jgi:hypothetical protein
MNNEYFLELTYFCSKPQKILLYINIIFNTHQMSKTNKEFNTSKRQKRKKRHRRNEKRQEEEDSFEIEFFWQKFSPKNRNLYLKHPELLLIR